MSVGAGRLLGSRFGSTNAASARRYRRFWGEPQVEMMITLYGNLLSTYCAKVRVVLRHKGIPFQDCLPPDGYGSAAYRKIVPMGTIPGFVDGDLTLSESEAISEYLEERYPKPVMLPGSAADRARIRALSRLHDCWVEPRLRALFAQARPENRDPRVVSAGVAEFERRLDGFAAHASDSSFIASETISLADCAWATTFIQAELLFDCLNETFQLPGVLSDWHQRLIAHPAVSPGLKPCRDAMVDWLVSLGAR